MLLTRLIHFASLGAVSACVLALALSAATATRASHNDGGTLAILSIAEDQFHNWDFYGGGAGVDWPITIIFGNNAEIDKVKDKYDDDAGWFQGTCGGDMWGHYNDGYALDWDTDRGMKVPCLPGCGATSYHVRPYAPPSTDRMYNIYWGYYSFASSHRDKNEVCPTGTQFGWSEDSENYTVDTAVVVFGWSAIHDWGYMYNIRISAWYGNHYVQNNGYASWVTVP